MFDATRVLSKVVTKRVLSVTWPRRSRSAVFRSFIREKTRSHSAAGSSIAIATSRKWAKDNGHGKGEAYAPIDHGSSEPSAPDSAESPPSGLAMHVPTLGYPPGVDVVGRGGGAL